MERVKSNISINVFSYKINYILHFPRINVSDFFLYNFFFQKCFERSMERSRLALWKVHTQSEAIELEHNLRDSTNVIREKRVNICDITKFILFP